MNASLAFDTPALALLGIPLLVAAIRLWSGSGEGRSVLALRLAAVLLVALALSGPAAVRRTPEVDVVFVVDRSLSMPPDASARAAELVGFAEAARPGGCRVGVVSFGRSAGVEREPHPWARFEGFTHEIDPDGSDLAGAIRRALGVSEAGRALRIVLVTDGKPTGDSPLATIPDVLDRRTPIDYRLLARTRDDRVAILEFDAPGNVREGSPVLLTAWVRGEGILPACAYTLRRGREVLERGTFQARSGRTRLVFRDRLPPGPGIHAYELEIEAAGDPTPENNRARAVVRAEIPARVLVVRAKGETGQLGRALEDSASPKLVDHVAPSKIPVDLAGLDPYRLVVLENVSVEEMPALRLRVLRAFVETMGGGLLVTGGRRSFGLGGYYKSELDPVLPVSLEMRTQQRKLSMALVIVLDRSGSMAASVGSGLEKMDLANRGAAAAIDLLGASDEVAVLAVDSEAHLVQELTKLSDKKEVIDRVLGIEAGGGGIYVYTGLAAAGDVIGDSTASTRHVALFADAADAEEPGDYQHLLDAFSQAGITVSVIGLGQATDSDGPFLEDVALRGGGRAFFAQDPADLPRLFSQDTLTVSQATFVRDPTPGRWSPDIHLLGERPEIAFPTVGGYNVAWPRPRAILGAVTDDEDASPLVAFWHRGTGRVGAFLAEADGEDSGGILTWTGYVPFFRTLARWLARPDEPPGVSLAAISEGHEARLVLEIDPADPRTRALVALPPTLLAARSDQPDRKALEIPFTRVADDRYEARLPLDGSGVHLPVVRLGGGGLLRGDPLVLPYSPEFRPPAENPADEGKALLDRLARATGGTERLSLDGLFDRWGVETVSRRSLVPFLALAALLALVAEIAFRRLELADLAIWRFLGRRVWPRGLVKRLASARPRRPRPVLEPTEAPAATTAPAAPPVAHPPPAVATLPAREPRPAPAAGGLADALREAKRRAGDRIRPEENP